MIEKNSEIQYSNKIINHSSNRSESSPYSNFYIDIKIPNQINSELNNAMPANQSFKSSITLNQNNNRLLRLNFFMLSFLHNSANCSEEAKKIEKCHLIKSLFLFNFILYWRFFLKNYSSTSFLFRRKYVSLFIGIYLIYLPFHCYHTSQITKSFNKLFAGMTDQEIEQRLNEMIKNIGKKKKI